MITNTFDPNPTAKLNPFVNPDAVRVDACIITFSYIIEKFVTETYDCEQIGESKSVTGITPVYLIKYKNKKFAFFKSYVGAPAAVSMVEDTRAIFSTDKYVLFGGAGCLDREIARGKVMIPTAAYRDEGTSYHYAPASDYIDIPGCDAVEAFMKENEIAYVRGKTWTTDAIFRETEDNFAKHKADGCISVEMECAGVQAVCAFRGLKLFAFFTSGDLLDSPKWTMRAKEGQIKHTQHDSGHFEIAIGLANYVSEV